MPPALDKEEYEESRRWQVIEGNCIPRKKTEIYFAEVSSSPSRQILRKSWRYFTKHQACRNLKLRCCRHPNMRHWFSPLEAAAKAETNGLHIHTNSSSANVLNQRKKLWLRGKSYCILMYYTIPYWRILPNIAPSEELQRLCTLQTEDKCEIKWGTEERVWQKQRGAETTETIHMRVLSRKKLSDLRNNSDHNCQLLLRIRH